MSKTKKTKQTRQQQRDARFVNATIPFARAFIAAVRAHNVECLKPGSDLYPAGSGKAASKRLHDALSRAYRTAARCHTSTWNRAGRAAMEGR